MIAPDFSAAIERVGNAGIGHDSVLVDRLFEVYDPFARLFSSYYTFEDNAPFLPNFNGVSKYRPDLYKPVGRRTDTYHRGRVAWFRDQFLQGKEVDPIEMDNEVINGCCYGPIITDGHHRFCGAILARRRRIEVYYSGRTDILDWLQGKTDTVPSF